MRLKCDVHSADIIAELKCTKAGMPHFCRAVNLPDSRTGNFFPGIVALPPKHG